MIGLVIGGMQSLLWLILRELDWPQNASTLLSISFGIWITGGLHFDGLIDTADGLAAGQKRLLHAMRDSNVGASGVLALVSVLFVQISAIISLDKLVPIAFPIVTFWGRFSSLLAIDHFSCLYTNGSGHAHKQNWQGKKEFIPAFLCLCVTILVIMFTPMETSFRTKLIIAISLGIIPSFVIPNWLGTRLGGHSGDSYGATVVIVETSTLLLLSIFFKII